jgi:hypothetical protein
MYRYKSIHKIILEAYPKSLENVFGYASFVLEGIQVDFYVYGRKFYQISDIIDETFS